MVEQRILTASENYMELDNYFGENGIRKVLLVCDTSIQFLRIRFYFQQLEDRLGIKVIKFSDFTPNPLYESVVNGVKVFHQETCDLIIAVGGGSAIDVAKCIKLYANMNHTKNYLEQNIVANEIKLMAVPTTAGTGSESTRYAVIYYNGEKQSVVDDSCIPSLVLMDASVLKTLPEYQKKATMMDAFCHAIESFWSVNSTEQSKGYSKKAIKLILENKRLYLDNDEHGNFNMLQAANLAGKAINITQTTAGHAMCYKLTSLYGIAHGHAAALCVSKLWSYMVLNLNKCIDARGKLYLQQTFEEIAAAMECKTVNEAIECYNEFLESLCLEVPKADEDDYNILSMSVNPVRLKNNPVSLDVESINMLYHAILS